MSDVGQPLSAEEVLRWTAFPEDYPCYYTPEGHDKGYYKPTSGCREKCCKEPACTPAGDDTPKWKATLAERMEGESPIAQPDFGQQEAETPDKTVLPDDYKAETGCTPPT